MPDPWILHMSDPHLGDARGRGLDDEKTVFEGQRDIETTQRVFQRTLRTLAGFVSEYGRPEVAVFSGDLAVQAGQSGFDAFVGLLSERADVLPSDRCRTVAVPGNHDVVWDEQPATEPRYHAFLGATRDQGCATPLLDGVDFDPDTGELFDEAARHPHVVSTETMLVVPINSSNYCGVLAAPPGAMTEEQWHEALEPLGTAREQLMVELRRMHRYDVPRVSRSQIEALNAYFERLRLPRSRRDDSRLRVAVLHHQLLPVSSREERKPFESLVNLGLVRETLQDYDFDLVLHGHKHEGSIYWDLTRERELTMEPSRTLVISSPGHFEVGAPVMRAIVPTGSPRARNVRIYTFRGAGAQRRHADHDGGRLLPLWSPSERLLSRDRTQITGPTAAIAYARLRSLFEVRGYEPLRNLMCQVDDPSDARTPPPDFPSVPIDGPQAWLDMRVEWWQLERSELVARDVVPFNHGERIYRRWGDQIDRAIRTLNERDESALVQLIGPDEAAPHLDYGRAHPRGSSPAFALAEFRVTDRGQHQYLECFGYFRIQEMQYWWPVNLAELARLQEKVRSGLEPRPRTGRIVTLAGIGTWNDAMPRGAGPIIDVLVEDHGRLLEMAMAVAFPDITMARATSDWQRVLRDLAGTDRDGPPRVSLGIELLCDHVQRLRAPAPGPELAAIADALSDLRDNYAAHADREEFPPAAARVVARLVARLAEAVTTVLPDAAP